MHAHVFAVFKFKYIFIVENPSQISKTYQVGYTLWASNNREIKTLHPSTVCQHQSLAHSHKFYTA
jgi:hypothetical protein